MKPLIYIASLLSISIPFGFGQQYPGGAGGVTGGGTNGGVYRDSSGQLHATATGGSGSLCLTSTNGAAPVYAACPGGGGGVGSSLPGQQVGNAGGAISSVQTYSADLFGSGTWDGAWSSSTAYPMCSAISYSSANYIAVAGSTNVTPGTNQAVWYELPLPAMVATPTPTNLDCGFYTLASLAVTNSVGYTLLLGDSMAYGTTYGTSTSLVEPITGGQVNLIGNGPDANHGKSYIKALNDMSAMIYAPDKAMGASTPYGLIISNLALDGNKLALQNLVIYGQKAGYIQHIFATGTNPTYTGAAPVVIGDGSAPYQNGAYQFDLDDINVQNPGNPVTDWAQVTVTGTGSSLTYTVTNAGTYVNIPRFAFLNGTKGNTAASPCGTLPSMTVTYTGSGPYTVTGVSGTGAFGCAGPYYLRIPDIIAAPQGIVVSLVTDSTFKDLVVNNTGRAYGIDINGSASSTIIHAHAYGGSQVLIYDAGGEGEIWIGTEPDTPTNIGIEGNPTSTYIGTNFATGAGAPPPPNVIGFYFPSGAGNVIQSNCPNTTASPSDNFNLIMGPSGPIPHGSLGGVFGNIIVQNGEECDTLEKENNQPNPLPVPPQASAVGYLVNTFFSSMSQYDVDTTQGYTSGSKWYFTNWSGTTPSPPSSVTYGNGYATIGASTATANNSISSAAQTTVPNWTGTAFGGGMYLEVSASFDPTTVQSNRAPSSSGGWPSIWTFALEHYISFEQSGALPDYWLGQANNYEHFFEADLLEYIPDGMEVNSFIATIHDWYGVYQSTCGGSDYCQVDNNYPSGGGSAFNNNYVTPGNTVDLNAYHRYGMLWIPATPAATGSVTYYFDGQPTTSYVTYSQYSISTTGTASSGSTALTIAAANSNIVGGNTQAVIGTGIATGTTVSSVSGTAVTLSTNTTGAVSGTVQIVSQPPPSAMTTWAFGVIDGQHAVINLSTRGGEPLNVRYVSVWQTNASNNVTQ